MNKLFEWQQNKNLSDKELADLLGYDVSMISCIRRGKRRPSPEAALKIEQVTKGMVTRMDVLYPDEDEMVNE